MVATNIGASPPPSAPEPDPQIHHHHHHGLIQFSRDAANHQLVPSPAHDNSQPRYHCQHLGCYKVLNRIWSMWFSNGQSLNWYLYARKFWKKVNSIYIFPLSIQIICRKKPKIILFKQLYCFRIKCLVGMTMIESSLVELWMKWTNQIKAELDRDVMKNIAQTM